LDAAEARAYQIKNYVGDESALEKSKERTTDEE
jgi:hypothetical protein